MTGEAQAGGDKQLLDTLKKLAADLYRTRERVKELEAGEREPIAVVGLGCRYAGGITGPEQFWDLLTAGTDAMGGFPADRGWAEWERAYGTSAAQTGEAYTRLGGFLYDVADFDAGFFGISPREALAMDPQQRVLLEVAWEAVERAGIDPSSLKGSDTGVFVGASSTAYGSGVAGADRSSEGYMMTGGLTAVVSGRISYTLGLTGPAVTVDTACSSSLVALHLAVQSLRSGECSLALAGGVEVLVMPDAFLEFSQQGGMAADGRCKSFAAEADGIGWGEGAGIIALERLSDARRNGHKVLGVIRGSAVNQDGASNGLTAPNGPSQRRVIQTALSDAGLKASDVDAVEAHGTGTTLGDPIEAQALLATYGQAEERAADHPLWLGSVKSNIGHSGCASGVAGVIKMVLALQHGVLPKTLHAEHPSPHVDWASGNVRLLREAVDWQQGDRPRRAGVSAFGVSGTNAHVILEEAPAGTDRPEQVVDGAPRVLASSDLPVWVVSGSSAAALAGQADKVREHLLTRPELPVGDVAWSLATTRAALEHRAVVLGADHVAGLAAVATGQPAPGVVTGSVAPGGLGRSVFVFPGQGSQWVGMGRELASASPVFEARLAECAAALAPYVDWELDDVLAGRHGFEAADVVQPALWAVMVSLAAVWQAAGVEPDAVVGHSQGEIAAAAVAGILSLEDAAKVVALRSKTLTALAGRGGMLSIAESVDGVRKRITAYGDRLSIAAVNGPASTVVSGDADALRELADSCGESPRARMIPVDYASHSVHVDELRDEILDVLQGIEPRAARIPMVSALTGEWLAGPEMDSAYWYSSLRETVEFERAVRILAEAGHGVFVEVSPHAVLTGAVGDAVDGVEDSVVVGTLRRDDGGARRLLASLAEAYVRGVPVDWKGILGGGTTVDLPTYAFQRRRYWLGAVAPVQAAATSVDDWRYRITWQPAGETAAALSGTWLVVGEGSETVANALIDRGAQVVTAAGPEDIDTTAEFAGVVSMLALDEEPLADHPWVPSGLAGTVDLVSVLVRAGVTAPLWVLTRGAMQVSADEVTTSPVQAQVWGLGRAVGLEHPDRWGGLVDLPPVWDAEVGARVAGILADGREDQVAVRSSGVFLRRLVHAEARRAEAKPWRPKGTVLLTGGTGSIGACVGPWLAEHGAPRVVLTSRSGPSAPGVAELASAVADGGTAVEIVSCDLAVRDEVTHLVEWIEASGPGLSTVLHSANAPYLARVEDTSQDGLATALGAKAAGAVYLDQATAGLDVDEFVLFSSISATWGSNDHGAYAAGNSFLDALAEDRRARGLPGTSIAWGVWNTRDWDAVDAVMDQAPGRVTPNRLLRQGMNFLDTDRALKALGEVLADDETFIALADVEWEKFAPVFRAARPRPLLETIPEAHEETEVADERGEFASRLAGLSVAERRRTVVELVRSQAAAVLGHDSAEEIVATRAFRELGFDSLTAVELRNRLNRACGLRLPSTVVFDHPSAAALADEIIGEWFGSDRPGQVVAVAAAPSEPIAIVGMACRYPGGVRTPEELWELLASGGDAIGAFPADRGWNAEALFDSDPDAEGSTYVVEGGFLTGAADFDAGFFGISPREALAMDPQQRLLLETSWEAIERAGIDPKSLGGSATGVFVGAASSGYFGAVGGEEGTEAHVITGNALSVLSGRIAYTLGLVGPAMTVDTACSSSLVALHQAVQALRSGECTVALAGGVTVMADPGEFVGFSRLRALSADGRCKAFADGADGMGMGEGVGMLLLERLSEAQRKGRRILGVIRGSAVNQDGASNGLSAPNGPSQQRVILSALANAQLSASDVDAVEAHGTGTSLGDPIEAGALLATYGQDRDRPLWLGSVKSNIGHAQQAAGVAGVIKMVMALQNGVLPKTLHADEPSSHVDWTSGNVRLLQESRDWLPGERTRRAGVSAFGISGTNVHLIVEEAPTAVTVQDPQDSAEPVLTGASVAWPISGSSAEALAGQAGRLREYVLARPELAAGDIAWSLATTRSALEHRAVVLGAERAAGLAAVATGQPAPGVVTGSVAPNGVGRSVFVFPGQGSQWVGMGRELAETSPVFAARLAECAAALAPYVDWELDDVLAGRHGFEAADIVQPALWAVMVSLAAVWQAAGVEPDAVVGHSQGEIAAAAVAGILSLADAAKVVALRSKTLTALAGRGGMLSVAEPVDAVRERTASYGKRLSIAAVNGPASTVVSGDADALRELVASYPESVRTRMIPVDYASHSAHVDELRAEILAVLNGITPREARIPMVSALTGEWLSGPELDRTYWYASLRETVEFDRAVQALAEAGHGVFVEVSPHPVLTGAIEGAVVVGTLRREDGGAERLLASFAEAYVRGLPVDWAAVLGCGSTVDLPTYAFQHRHYWPKAAVDSPRTEVVDAEFWDAVEGGDLSQLAATLNVDDGQLGEVLPALAEYRRRSQVDASVADWRYKISWVPVSDTDAVLTGKWLVVGVGPDVSVVANALVTRGAEVVTADGPNHVDQVVTGDLSGVVSLLALDESPDPDFAWVSRGSAGTLALIQALNRADVTAPLWVLTRGAVRTAASDSGARPVQAEVWGLGVVAGLELVGRWGGLVDLPPVVDARAGARLAGVLADAAEDQVAVRSGGVVARRLVRAGRPVVRNAWSPRGSVLVTGGTSGVGAITARWVAGRGASRVVLTSRSGPAAAGVAELASSIVAGGSAVDVVACDVADRTAVEQLLGRIDATGPELSSVMHAAGVGDRRAVTEMETADLSQLLSAKAGGAAVLDELTAGRELDAFVLFSSGAGVWGSGGLSGYAAANAYLDALCDSRRSWGLVASSVAWGLWAGVGMAASQGGERLREFGMEGIDEQRGMLALGQVLDADEGAMVVAGFDWPQFVPTYTLHRPSRLLADLPEVRASLTTDTAVDAETHDVGEWAARLAGMPVSEQKQVLTDLVRGHAAAVLGYDSAEDVLPQRAFKDLGFDSAGSVQLRNRLSEVVGVRLVSTMVFDYPNAAALAEYLRGELVSDASVQGDGAVQVVAAAHGEPIAIVGMGCRFPGGVTGPEQFWDLVAAGTDTMGGFPVDRGWEAFEEEFGNGQTYRRLGGFIYDVGDFDAGFFGISPREALSMDPQQRLLLETSWEAVERAGIDPKSLHGSATGVFVGANFSGYSSVLPVEDHSLDGYRLIGNVTAVHSGRISYTLGLTGPAVTVDTACSSSLVAMHQAVSALRAGECSMALAGGVAVMVSPAAFMEFSQQGGMASSGRCKAFSDEADGIGWGEGAGMVLLERLSDAQRNGHQVLAVIRGSAANQDGASNGLAAPNGPSQRRVIRAALANAQLSPSDVDAVEAHGTGTTLGDPIEAGALLATYGQDRDRPLWLGSVKSNIGHTQCAAGVAGVIKMVMALQKGELPKTLFADEPSSHVDWESGNVRLLQDAVEWSAGDRPRRAGVSAFGVSGTNVHVILEEAPQSSPVQTIEATAPVLAPQAPAWVVSGHSAAALAGQAGRLREYVLARPDTSASDVAWSLASTRAALDHRAVVLGAEYAAGLAAVATGQPAQGVITGSVAPSGVGRTVFVFPGQGSQWVGMGRELAETSPVFAARLAECAEALSPYVDWELDDVLAGRHGFEAADVVQPALWAVMVSLAAVWDAAGVRPDAVVGHSQGEIAAAAVAGILSLEDAAKVVALRSKMLTALAGRGGMLSIAEPVDGVRQRIASYGERLSIAAVNGPSSTVVSGDADALRELADLCGESPRARMIPVDYASHSAHVDELREEILEVLQGIQPRAAQVPMVSALTGEWLSGQEMDPSYWYSSLRETVEFDRAVRVLAANGYGVFVETSPHAVLTGAVADATEDVDGTVVVGTLRRDEGGAERLLGSFAEAYVQGAPVDWSAVLGSGSVVALPTYAFQRRRFWPEPRAAKKPSVDDWRYRITWQQADGGLTSLLSGTWLLVGDAPDVSVVADSLTDHGATVVRTTLTGLDEAVAAAGDLSGVVSLLALDESPDEEFPWVPRGSADTLALVQALGRAGTTAPLWVLTRGAVQVGPDEVTTSPVQAQLWGLGRAVGLEHPDRWGGLVDLPPVVNADSGARLARVLADGGEDQVAVRSSGVFLRRLVRAEARRAEAGRWSPRGTVLLTGGTGSIGVCIGPWLAEHETQRVVLTSRSGPSAPGVSELAASVAGAGTDVEVVSCDLGVREQVASLVSWVQESGPGLSTVLHSANTPFLARVQDTDREGLAAALGAKAAGARYLDEATASLAVDEFVMFSSISATWGSNDHAAYAAGNSYLDALAEDRRARGLPGTSIAWGVWNTRDWAAVDKVMDQAPGRVTPNRLLRQGMNFLDTGRALTALGEVLADDETFIAVADVEWEKFAPVFCAARSRPLLETIPEAHEETEVTDERGEFASRLASMSAPERRRTVIELVRSHAAVVLGHESVDEIVSTRAFRELGFDSLTAVELRNRLNTAVGIRLPATVIFDHPSASALADEILSELFGGVADESIPMVVQATSTEPIAIVGMACRYPGGVRTPEELWELLVSGGDAIGGFPTDRGWDAEALFDPDPDAEGSTYVVEGGFLTGAADFDAGFFGISPREALAMDPQQRLLLETSWEAIERAGIDPKSLGGSATGVFVGAAASGYIGALSEEAGAQAHLITGNALSVLSGRVSYTLGLNGPAVTVDTACSSSLVALHQAVQALRSGECSMALAGGVTVMADPGEFVSFSRLRALSADGRCKAFGDGADGMGMGEGVGMLMLERLSEAQRNGHKVLGVIRGSAVNQDGASNGLTAPNGPAQRRVIRAALASAQLSASDVDVVEAHGTGTELGDPIEAGALLATYGQGRDRPLWLGSVKSNIGHAQQAAGVAGVIKMVMALQNGVLPRTLHADEPSSHVDWTSGNVRLLQESRDWLPGERTRRAGVSAFGISGTNAHVIVEEAPIETEASVEDEAVPVLTPQVSAWMLSGRDADALASQAGRLREYVLARPELAPGDVAWSLASTRAALEHRAVVLGADRSNLAAGLAAVATGQPAVGVSTGVVAPGGVGRSVFVFPGQGSQWVGMGRELAEASPVFKAKLADCAAALAPYVEWELDDVLAGRHGFEAADVVQPALWAVMVSLAAVWQAAGVEPDAVVGHSQGEIAAAAVAGILSLEDAAKVVALRSKTLTALAGRGGMLSIAESVDGVRERIASYGERLSIAAVNGPSATVVSGDADALRELAGSCGESPRARMIPVDYASHSAHVDELRGEILNVLQGIRPREAQVPMVSALTGEWLTGLEMDPSYWYASLRETVEFERAVKILAEAGHGVFVETSPHPVLTGAIEGAVVVGTLRREDGGAERLLASFAEAYVRGLPVDWPAVLGRGSTVDLPTYAFQHRHYWPETDNKRAEVVAATGAEAGFWTAVESGDATALADLLGVNPTDETLGALTDWRRRERADSSVADWRYRVSWVPVSESDGTLTGTWLVVGDGPDAAVIAEALESHGAMATRTTSDRLHEAVATSWDLNGVVSLLALNDGHLAEHPLIPAGLAGTVELTQALGRLGVSAPLWVLTRGAVRTSGDSAVDPVQAQVWGLGVVAGLELAGRWGGLVDLPPVVDARAGARLAGVLADAAEDQVAVRSGGVVARRLVRAGRPVVRNAWSPRGSVLVTGGTSGVGAITARWVADRSASRVVLTSRSGPAAAGVAELAGSIAASGSAVDVVACDIADRASADALLRRTDATGPVLSSIVHSAGVGGHKPLSDLESADLSTLLSAKVGGAAVLDELTADRELDAFVLFSSGAGVWGSGGLSGYAAANAYLDALAEDRRARGLTASSVAWGLWAGVGMAANAGGDRLRDFGMEGIDEQRGMLALGQVLDADEGAMVVAGFDWPQFLPTYTLRRPSRLLADLPEVRATLTDDTAEAGTGEWADRLAGMPVAEQQQVLTDLVRGHAAAVLGHESAEDVLPQRAFKDMGFDSAGAVELRNRLSQVVGVQLSSTMVFDYPNAAALADQIWRELMPEHAAEPDADLEEVAFRETIAAIPMARIREAGLLDLLLNLAEPAGTSGGTETESIDEMDAESLIRRALDGKDS